MLISQNGTVPAPSARGRGFLARFACSPYALAGIVAVDWTLLAAVLGPRPALGYLGFQCLLVAVMAIFEKLLRMSQGA